MELAPVEYYYGEVLRWGFGFDNPNKAAVLFACGLPLIWLGWTQARKVRLLWLRAILAICCASGFLAADYCLTMTFSRGGLVAAIAGLFYMLAVRWWRSRRVVTEFGSVGQSDEVSNEVESRFIESTLQQTPIFPTASNGETDAKSPIYKWLSIGLLIVAMAIPVCKGLGDRSLEAVGTADASVGNRLILWKHAMQMAYENPLGFGKGNSGEQYMQWYQPIEMTAGYRTMVNSYLTFLVEQGWAWSLLVLAVVGFFWGITNPDPRGNNLGELIIPLRGVLVAFAIAGLFSTVMEESLLWILPGMCAAALLALRWMNRAPVSFQKTFTFWGVAVAGCALLLIGGWWQDHGDALERRFTSTGQLASIRPKAPKSLPSIDVIVDSQVIGPNYGKRLRQLAQAGFDLQMVSNTEGKVQLVMGNEIGRIAQETAGRSQAKLYLLAPASTSQEEARKIVQGWKQVFLLLPEIDEDGRTGLWEKMADGKNIAMLHLPNVGNQVDWAWLQIIEYLKKWPEATGSSSKILSQDESKESDENPPQLPPLPVEAAVF